ncbi:MAG: SGNH/GDSL hydrolase family protein [Armatimonadota bacterium]
MKKIALIGDSIRMGYQATVIEQLAGAAEIVSPEKNGGDSRNVLANLDAWVIDLHPDIVHLNCGLHDLKREFATPEQTQVPLEEYRQNLEAIFRRITDTGATLIWATITPVIYEKHHAVKGFDRREEDVDAFNAAALAVAGKFNLPVDDLHAVVMQAGREQLMAEGDGVHFFPDGYRVLGTAVADYLRKYA